MADDIVLLRGRTTSLAVFAGCAGVRQSRNKRKSICRRCTLRRSLIGRFEDYVKVSRAELFQRLTEIVPGAVHRISRRVSRARRGCASVSTLEDGNREGA